MSSRDLVSVERFDFDLDNLSLMDKGKRRSETFGFKMKYHDI